MKGEIRARQCWALIVLTLCGYALTMPAGGRDEWFAILLAAAASLLLTALYSKPCEQLQTDCFAVLSGVYGRIGGALLGIGLSALAFWGLCMTTLSFVVFLRTAAPDRWPVWLIAALVLLTAGWVADGGMRRLALWAEPCVWVVLFALVLSLVLTLPDAEAGHLTPFLAEGGLYSQVTHALALPFAECWFAVALLGGRCGSVRGGAQKAMVTAGVLLTCTALRNVAVLGLAGAQSVWYPTFTAAGLIELGQTFQRGEVLVSGSLLLCIVARAAVFLTFVSEGVAESVPVVPRRPALWGAAALSLILSVALAGSTADFLRAEQLYRILLLPVLLTVSAVTAVGAGWKRK